MSSGRSVIPVRVQWDADDVDVDEVGGGGGVEGMIMMMVSVVVL